MEDVQAAVAQAFNVVGLKPRNPAQILETLKNDFQIEGSVDNGFLSLKQGSTDMDVAKLTQSYFKKYPADFVGHVGEVNFKSDVQDNEAKMRLIKERGFDWWNALPANDKSPTAKHVVKPVIVSTQMKRDEWLQLTPDEKTNAISQWGASAQETVGRIMARRK